MTARETILAAVRDARPTATRRPDLSGLMSHSDASPDIVRAFAQSAAASGARVIEGRRAERDTILADIYQDAGRRVSTYALSSRTDDRPHSFADTAVFICEAEVGVAENGALWLPLSRLRHRAAVFLATNVIIVVDCANIVADLHAAYAAIDVAADGFGVFIAGPSKTADIEQTLVIGAHGAVSLTVLLLCE